MTTKRNYRREQQNMEQHGEDRWIGPRIRVELVREYEPVYEHAVIVPQDVINLVGETLRRSDRERMLSIALDAAHHVVAVEEVSVGTATNTPVHPREVMKALILANAAAFILVHNHPSGNAEPSNADWVVTRQMERVGELMDIKLLDHIIIAGSSHWSWNAVTGEGA